MKKSLFLILFLFQFEGYGQNIVYTGLTPYDTLYTGYSGSSYNLDLNNDGTIDFVIRNFLAYYECNCGSLFMLKIVITPAAGNAILDRSGWVNPLNYNDSISGECQIWSNDSDQIMLNSAPFCNEEEGFECDPTYWEPWPDDNGAYAGLLLSAGGHFFYGWVRVYYSDVLGAAIITDYAYNDSAGMKIFAGYMASGIAIENYNMQFINIFPNPVANQLTIRTSSFNNNEHANIIITNLLGQTTSPPTPLLEERGAATIDVSGLSAGMYFVEVVGESGRWVGRFVKE